MAANNDPALKKGYAAPLEGNGTSIMSMLRDCLTTLTSKLIAGLTSGSASQGPAVANPVADMAASPVKPTVATAPAPPKPRE